MYHIPRSYETYNPVICAIYPGHMYHIPWSYVPRVNSFDALGKQAKKVRGHMYKAIKHMYT